MGHAAAGNGFAIHTLYTAQMLRSRPAVSGADRCLLWGESPFGASTGLSNTVGDQSFFMAATYGDSSPQLKVYAFDTDSGHFRVVFIAEPSV